MDRQTLDIAFRRSGVRVWDLVDSVIDRIPQHTRTLVERALDRMYAGVAEWLTAGQKISHDTEAELGALGLSLSRLLAWDVVDEINKAFFQIVIETAVDLENVDLGLVARGGITVSDVVYDGFWVFNNHEAFEQALRLGSLLDHLPMPTFMLDEFGTITFANKALCRALGARPGDLEATKLEDLVVSETSIFSNPESSVTISDEHSETRHYKLTLSPIVSTDRTEHFGQLIDRTGEVNLERTKEQVIATIAHELRTPLTAVVGYAEILHEADISDQDVADADRIEAITVIHEQARHLLDLVSDLVDFARLDTGTIRLKQAEVDLRSAIESVARRVETGEDQSVHIRVPHRTHLWVDRTRLEQLLSNLLTNATRYGGPEISIEAWPLDHATTAIRFADNGDGISRADQARIFESFYQGGQTHVGVGSGMGLAICKAIVRAHGRNISLEDAPGASFIIELPTAA